MNPSLQEGRSEMSNEYLLLHLGPSRPQCPLLTLGGSLAQAEAAALLTEYLRAVFNSHPRCQHLK